MISRTAPSHKKTRTSSSSDKPTISERNRLNAWIHILCKDSSCHWYKTLQVEHVNDLDSFQDHILARAIRSKQFVGEARAQFARPVFGVSSDCEGRISCNSSVKGPASWTCVLARTAGAQNCRKACRRIDGRQTTATGARQASPSHTPCRKRTD